MTYSETKFREYIKKAFNDPEIYIKKMPDKKIVGGQGAIGLPDYLIISKNDTSWFEVKQVTDKKYNVCTFNLNEISESQYIEFNKMTNAGAKIFIAIYLNKESYIIPYYNIQFAKFIAGEKSIHKTILEKWRTKWNQKNLSKP